MEAFSQNRLSHTCTQWRVGRARQQKRGQTGLFVLEPLKESLICINGVHYFLGMLSEPFT